VLKAWKKNNQDEKSLARLFGSLFSRPATRMVLTGVLALLFILGFASTLIPGENFLAGTATGLQALAPIFILAGVLLVALLFWLDNRK
jgi:hypothetical protein